MPKVFITGGTGLVGSHIVEEYQRQGWNVTVLTRDARNARMRLRGNVDFVEGDILDAGTYKHSLSGHDLLIHSAAYHTSWAPGREDAIYNTNVSATINILEAAENAGIKDLIYTSSTKTIGYNPKSTLQNESAPYDYSSPDSPYGISKARAEDEVIRYEGSLNIRILNPTAVIGRFDTQPTPTGLMMLKAIREKVHLYLDMPLSFVDARDVARAHYNAYFMAGHKQRYILSAPPVMMREFFACVDDAIGRKRPFARVPYSALMPAAHAFDIISKFKHLHPPVTKTGAKVAKRKIAYDGTKAQRQLQIQYTDIFKSIRDSVTWFMGECPKNA